MVPNREISPTCRDERLQPTMQRPATVGFEVEVELNGEVEAFVGNPNVEIGDNERNIEVAFSRRLAGALDGDVAEVDGGDVPALFS